MRTSPVRNHTSCAVRHSSCATIPTCPAPTLQRNDRAAPLTLPMVPPAGCRWWTRYANWRRSCGAVCRIGATWLGKPAHLVWRSATHERGIGAPRVGPYSVLGSSSRPIGPSIRANDDTSCGATVAHHRLERFDILDVHLAPVSLCVHDDAFREIVAPPRIEKSIHLS